MEHEQLYCNALPDDTGYDKDTVAILLVKPAYSSGFYHFQSGHDVYTIARGSCYALEINQWITNIALRGWHPISIQDLPLYIDLKIKYPLFEQIISGQYKGNLPYTKVGRFK